MRGGSSEGSVRLDAVGAETRNFLGWLAAGGTLFDGGPGGDGERLRRGGTGGFEVGAAIAGAGGFEAGDEIEARAGGVADAATAAVGRSMLHGKRRGRCVLIPSSVAAALAAG
jgi:hypothetical protein